MESKVVPGPPERHGLHAGGYLIVLLASLAMKERDNEPVRRQRQFSIWRPDYGAVTGWSQGHKASRSSACIVNGRQHNSCAILLDFFAHSF